jgi:hypothetical protein
MDNCGDAAMGFQGMGKSTAMGNTGVTTCNGKRADRLTHTGPPLIAVSLHRLILGGLLPSRARVRFTGSLLIHDQIKRTQSRVGQGRPNVSHRRNKGGAVDAMGTGEQVFPVSVSLRPYREREAETVMVSA